VVSCPKVYRPEVSHSKVRPRLPSKYYNQDFGLTFPWFFLNSPLNLDSTTTLKFYYFSLFLVAPLSLFLKIFILFLHSNFLTLLLTPILLNSREFRLRNLGLDFLAWNCEMQLWVRPRAAKRSNIYRGERERLGGLVVGPADPTSWPNGLSIFWCLLCFMVK
jgi:hypothetical protein